MRLRDDAPQEGVDRLTRAVLETPEHIPGVLMLRFSRVARGPKGVTYVEDNVLAERAAVRGHPYHGEVLVPALNAVVEATHVLFPQPYAQETPEPGISSFLKRTLLLEVAPETPPAQVEEFERRLTDMPKYIHGIRNWAMSRNPEGLIKPEPDNGLRWTHVWEQEFQDEAGFQDYMMSPFHWGWVDQMFDPDGPGNMCRSNMQLIYPAAETILGWRPEA